jgi:hypothetical protein
MRIKELYSDLSTTMLGGPDLFFWGGGGRYWFVMRHASSSTTQKQNTNISNRNFIVFDIEKSGNININGQRAMISFFDSIEFASSK